MMKLWYANGFLPSNSLMALKGHFKTHRGICIHKILHIFINTPPEMKVVDD